MEQEQILFSLPLQRMEPIFKNWVRDVIAESKSTKDQTIDDTAEDYEPRDETMKRLRVRSYATMIKYERLGFLKPYRLGRSIFYKKSEVDQSMIKFQRA